MRTVQSLLRDHGGMAVLRFEPIEIEGDNDRKVCIEFDSANGDLDRVVVVIFMLGIRQIEIAIDVEPHTFRLRPAEIVDNRLDLRVGIKCQRDCERVATLLADYDRTVASIVATEGVNVLAE